MSISYIGDNNGGYSVFINGTLRQFDKSHPKFAQMVQYLKDGDAESLLSVIDRGTAIQKWSLGAFEFNNGVLTYEGDEVHGTLTNRILSMMEEGFDHLPMLRFIERLYQNPSANSVLESYDFLSNKGLPITPEGHFLAYKAVSVYSGEPKNDLTGKPMKEGDFVDKYTGKSYRNNVGDLVEMKRNKVDDDRHNGCSRGLHVGSLEYVRNYGGGNSKYVVVKVNPADIVSVPADEACQKVRVCKYDVVGMLEAEFTSSVVDSYDEDDDRYWDDSDDYDDDHCGEDCDCC